jgi:hypothetical protein
MEMLVAFCVIFVEQCRYKGGDALCSFWEPGVVYKTRQECVEGKKLIEEYLEEELWRLYPEAVKINAKGVCPFEVKDPTVGIRDKVIESDKRAYNFWATRHRKNNNFN